MLQRKALVVAPKGELREKLAAFIRENEMTLVMEAESAPSALRALHLLEPDLLLMDGDLPQASHVARVIDEDFLAPAVFITSSSHFPFPALRKPLDLKELQVAVEYAAINFERLQSLGKEVKKLKESLQERKVLEKAKGILMETLKLNEEEAYSLLRKKSMDGRKPIKDVAETIIEARYILKKKTGGFNK